MFSSLFLSFANIPPENNNNKQTNFSLLLSFLRKCPATYMHPSSLHFIYYIFITMRDHAKREFSSPESTFCADSYFGIRSTVLPL